MDAELVKTYTIDIYNGITLKTVQCSYYIIRFYSNVFRDYKEVRIENIRRNTVIAEVYAEQKIGRFTSGTTIPVEFTIISTENVISISKVARARPGYSSYTMYGVEVECYRYHGTPVSPTPKRPKSFLKSLINLFREYIS